MAKIHYIERKAAILDVLKGVAKCRRTVTYKDLGAVLGIPPTGPWKGVLDSLGDDQKAKGLPDITVLVVRGDTRYPAQIQDEDARKPTAEQKKIADETFEAVWKAFA